MRAAYGLYNRYQWNGVFNTERVNLLQTNITIRNPTYPDPYGGRDPLAFASTAPPNITIVANDIRNPLAKIANVGVSRELFNNMAVNVGRGLHEDDRQRDLDQHQHAEPGDRPAPAAGVGPHRADAVGRRGDQALLMRVEKRFADRYM